MPPSDCRLLKSRNPREEVIDWTLPYSTYIDSIVEDAARAMCLAWP